MFVQYVITRYTMWHKRFLIAKQTHGFKTNEKLLETYNRLTVLICMLQSKIIINRCSTNTIGL